MIHRVKGFGIVNKAEIDVFLELIRDYYQQLYANKMDNLEEMDEFLERYYTQKESFSLKIHVLILISNVMVFEGEALGK